MNEGFDDPAVARQRRRVGLWAVGAKALLLAVLVGAWWVWERGGWAGAGSAAPQVANPGPSALGSDRPSGAQTFDPAAAHAGAAQAASAPRLPMPMASLAASAPQRPRGPVELCGVGTLRGDPEPPHLFKHAVAAAWPRVLATMAQSPAERSRAAALVLRRGLQLNEMFTLGTVPPAEPLVSLLAMAQASPDPALLRWASNLCTLPGATSGCRELSAEGLVVREPEDMAHWLLLLQTDPSQADRTLKGAAAASQFSPVPALLPWVEAALPADLPAYLRHLLRQETHALQTAYYGSLLSQSLGELTKRCRSPGADRAVCRAFAENLQRQAPDVSALPSAWLIGQAQGWSQERVAAARARARALSLEFVRLSGPDDPPERALSCPSIERDQRVLRDVATYGELGALRRWQAAASAPAAAPR